jgi:hypothetical protein
MPVYIDAEMLQQIIQPCLAIRKDGECRIDIEPDTIRLRAMSESREAYVDYSLPTTVPQLSADGVTDSFTVWLDRIQSYLNIGTGDEVKITTPDELSDSIITLQSDGLTYRFQPVDSRYAHRVFDTFSTESLTQFSLRNGVFDRAVAVANLVGGEMRVQHDPKTQRVEFSADSHSIPDAFSYSHSVKQINTHQLSSTNLTISIERLRDVTPLFPPTAGITVQLARNHLVFQAEYPITGADFTFYTAKRRGALHN